MDDNNNNNDSYLLFLFQTDKKRFSLNLKTKSNKKVKLRIKDIKKSDKKELKYIKDKEFFKTVHVVIFIIFLCGICYILFRLLKIKYKYINK